MIIQQKVIKDLEKLIMLQQVQVGVTLEMVYIQVLYTTIRIPSLIAQLLTNEVREGFDVVGGYTFNNGISLNTGFNYQQFE